jgi:hypothetical protein
MLEARLALRLPFAKITSQSSVYPTPAIPGLPHRNNVFVWRSRSARATRIALVASTTGNVPSPDLPAYPRHPPVAGCILVDKLWKSRGGTSYQHTSELS